MSAFEQNRLPRSVRCYRALLRVYPRTFREEFELLLCQAFGDLSQRAASGGGMRRIGFWLRTVVDLLSSAIDHRFGNSPVRSLRLRWVLACAMGIPLGAVLTFLDLFTLRSVPSVLRLTVTFGFKRGDPLVFVAVIACVVSFPLGWLQSRAFGWNRARRLLWLAATVLGVSTGWTVMYNLFSGSYLWTSIVAYRAFTHPVGFILCGSIIGLFQMGVLAHKTARAWAWVPACAIAMVAVGYFVDAVPMDLSPILAGAIFGIVTAGPLTWIIGESNAALDPSRNPKFPRT